MEYRLNKIDTEVRQIINDATKEGKVHNYKELNKVNKDGRNNNQDQSGSFKEQLEKSQKEKITVNAVKFQEINVDALKDDYIGELNQGRFLDTKR